MNNEQLEAQSREAIKAWCDDPSVQLEFCDKDSLSWMLKDHMSFHTGMFYYRAAKPKKWYRVALLVFGVCYYTETVDNEKGEVAMEIRFGFVKWLDERKYYD